MSGKQQRKTREERRVEAAKRSYALRFWRYVFTWGMGAWGALRLLALLVPGHEPFPEDQGNAEGNLRQWQAWTERLRWPSLGQVVGAVLLACLMMGVGLLIDRVLLRKRYRRISHDISWAQGVAEVMKHTIRVRHTKLRGGSVNTVVSLRKHGSWTKLEKALDLKDGELLRKLEIPGLGTPVLEPQFFTEGLKNPARTHRVHLVYQPLPHPSQVPAWLEPAKDGKLVVGIGHEGPVYWNIDHRPHMSCQGESGSGKGFLTRLIETQALKAGWLVMLIDGESANEHAVLDPAPNAWRVIPTGAPLQKKLEATRDALAVATKMLSAREVIQNRESTRFGRPVGRWIDMSTRARRENPPLLVIVEGVTGVFEPSGSKVLDPIRREIQESAITLLRQARKHRVAMYLADQEIYATSLRQGDQRQARFLVLLGNPTQEQAMHVASRKEKDLPTVPEIPCCGVAGTIGKRFEEIRVPNNDPESLQRVVQQVAQIYEAQQPLAPRPQPVLVGAPVGPAPSSSVSKPAPAPKPAGKASVDGSRCAVPGCEKKDLTKDHIVPKARGGPNDPSNIQMLCSYHNGMKGQMTQEEFQRLLGLWW